MLISIDIHPTPTKFSDDTEEQSTTNIFVHGLLNSFTTTLNMSRMKIKNC